MKTLPCNVNIYKIPLEPLLQTFRKIAILFSRCDVIKFVFPRGNDSLCSYICYTFLRSKMVFLNQNYTSYKFQPFLKKIKIFMCPECFVTFRLKNDCSSTPWPTECFVTSRLKNDCSSTPWSTDFAKILSYCAEKVKMRSHSSRCLRLAAII